MPTKAQLLAAAKKIIAAHGATKAKPRKKNPAPRIGTAAPKRRSQATGKAPSKRLVTRRKANAKKGYFPNPAEVKAAHTKSSAYHMEFGVLSASDNPIAIFAKQSDAEDFANFYAQKHKKTVRAVKF